LSCACAALIGTSSAAAAKRPVTANVVFFKVSSEVLGGVLALLQTTGKSSGVRNGAVLGENDSQLGGGRQSWKRFRR
jgi:hypothetical protein